MAKVFDFEVLAVNSTTQVTLTSSKYDHNGGTRASKATIQVGATPIYFLFATTTPVPVPTATEGYIGNTGDVIEIFDFDNMRNLQIIAQAGSGTVYVEYES